MTDQAVIIVFAAGLALLLAVLLLLRRGPRVVPDTPQAVPANAILVDGSNVMHWGGDPSPQVLRGVIRDLERQGFAPFVCFDANVGYKLWGRWQGPAVLAGETGLPQDRIYVVDKGVVADAVLLDLAGAHGLKVVTNDRFRDWSVRYPWVKDHRRFRRGTWKGGNVVWRK